MMRGLSVFFLTFGRLSSGGYFCPPSVVKIPFWNTDGFERQEVSGEVIDIAVILEHVGRMKPYY